MIKEQSSARSKLGKLPALGASSPLNKRICLIFEEVKNEKKMRNCAILTPYEKFLPGPADHHQPVSS